MSQQLHILHLDADCFYASCELVNRPELRGKPVVVGGDESLRHGIVLAKTYEAKRLGIATADPLWRARSLCPELIVLPPHHGLYLEISRKLRAICYEYTPNIEGFGLDECWMDVSGCPISDGRRVAEELQRRVLRELGISVSIGVSYNKIFAKLGSDLKKPGGLTVISPDNYKRVIWPLPARDLLYVGAATADKLAHYGVHTIGDLAAFPGAQRLLGKLGPMLVDFANGIDQSRVAEWKDDGAGKSIGYSTTTYRDLENRQDVALMLRLLSDGVARRVRDAGLLAQTLAIWVRDSKMFAITRQRTLARPTQMSVELADTAMALFCESYAFTKPVRSIGVRVSGLVPSSCGDQLCFDDAATGRVRRMALEQSVDRLNDRWGEGTVRVATLLLDRKLSGEKMIDVAHAMNMGDFQGA